MIQIIVPQSVVLTFIVLVVTQVKWAWDYLLYQSFFHPYSYGIKLPEYFDDHTVTHYQNNADQAEYSIECAVCLCRFEEGDEIRELRCDHLFHRVCLDRWLGYGRVTCPICRNNLRLAPSVEELHQEIIIINFSATTSRDRCAWWLR
ncbi:RING-H2 finger protein ATL13-like [Olea europaea var. sylvestris]|uniref:E3 ubiquitin- ligase RHA2B-like n=1 Tax=Olea europaea subsp. europaea TaxID=158383 RepID=A0A8S0UDP0_OLEEU|nr:RING-H2 finger protein ATL13-like [Olea europaea var. sylvestris]CAA3015733.1 E3 ubiquitin- ligase RHA2B-like [Olea europaea subsp. europaea]